MVCLCQTYHEGYIPQLVRLSILIPAFHLDVGERKCDITKATCPYNIFNTL